MATVSGLTAERMQEIIDATIVDADIISNHLILTKEDGGTIDAGELPTPEGGGGIEKVTAFPTDPAPEDGDYVTRIDLPGDPTFKYVDGAWEQQPRMGAQTVPSARATRITDFSVPNASTTAIPFTVESKDTDSMVDIVGQPNRITIKTPGLYVLSGDLEFTAHATGIRTVGIRRNGTEILTEARVDGDSGDQNALRLAPCTIFTLVSGDYLELVAYQSSGAALTAIARSNGPALSVAWLGGAGQTVDERSAPFCRLRRSANHASQIWSGSGLPFDVEIADNDNMHDGTNPSRITARTPGVYHISGIVAYDANASVKWADIRKNGATVIASVNADPADTGSTRMHVDTIAELAAGDYVELVPASATSVVVMGGNEYDSTFSMSLVATGKTVTPYSRARLTSTQSIPNNADAIVIPNVEDVDRDLAYDPVTGRFTCRTAGVYAFAAMVGWASNGSGYRNLGFKRNRLTTPEELGNDRVAAVSGAAMYQSTCAIAEMAVGDTLEVFVVQTSGAALNLNSCNMQVVKVGADAGPSSGIEVVEGWHVVGAAGEPAFQANWTNLGGTYGPVRFRKDRGRVTIHGVAVSGVVGQSFIFTLPVGYRPSARVMLPIRGPSGYAAIEVLPDGQVWQAAGAVGNHYLDSVSFYVD